MVCTRFFIVFPPGASITAASRCDCLHFSQFSLLTKLFLLSSAVSTSEEFIRQVESAMIGLE
jgi:hypothetical protein